MKKQRKFVVDILFVLALFGVFAISALVLVSIGADVYQHTIRDMSSNYDSRTATAYVTEKLRRSDHLLSDGTSAVSIDTLEAQSVLKITEELDTANYNTYLYYYDGWLRELCVREDLYLDEDILEAGQKILKLNSLDLEQTAYDIVHIKMTLSDGESRQLYLGRHCNETTTYQ